MSVTRPQIDRTEDLMPVLNESLSMWIQRLNEKGDGIFVSSHEMMGIIKEEFDEYCETVQNAEHRANMRNELLDIIVACAHSIASIDSNQTDWL